MGWYINKNSRGESAPAKGKVQFLKEDGAEIIQQPESFSDTLVVVVDNGPFEAAAYIKNQKEYNEFTQPQDNRNKVWLNYNHAVDVVS